MLRGCSIAWMLLTTSLASGAGDHLASVPDRLLAWASISVSHPLLLLVFCGRRNSPRLATVRDGDGKKQFISFRVNTRGAGAGLSNFGGVKKKGAPACAGAPQRSGHCRVCARTGVVDATP